MPANLPPQSRAAERRYTQAKNLPDKIRYLQEFISTIPEHKGNEKMRGYLRRRLAQLKEELEEDQRRKKSGSGGGGGFSVRKEGAAQIVLVGVTGAGKSTLLSKVTNAKTEVAEHAFTTREPVPGMLAFEDIQFQLVDTPAIFRNVYEGSWGPQLMSLLRNADGLLIVLDAVDADGQLDVISRELASAGITTEEREGRIDIEKTSGGGIQIACMGRISCRVFEIEKRLKEAGIRNAIVRVRGNVGVKDVEEALDQTKTFKPAVIVINKADMLPTSPAELAAGLREKAREKEILAASARSGNGLEGLGGSIFRSLGIARVYTKDLGGNVAKKPIIVSRGAKVMDIAKIVHSQLYRNFKYAKVNGKSVKYNGERVGVDHMLADGDIVEIRIK